MGLALRIAVGGILTECNHLGGLPIDMALYESSELLRDEEILEQEHSVVGGMVGTLKDASVETIPLIFASACAAGPIAQDCYEQLKEELFQRLRDRLPVDGVLLPLHGSALCEHCDDPEGDLIQTARQIVGPEVPIVVTLDLHAFVTQQMIDHADALLGWETYPHRDQFQTGQRATRLLLDIIAGKCKPAMAFGRVPVITSAINGSTNDNDPFAELMRFTKSLESNNQVLSTSLFLIHPYMDCANMGSGGLVITNHDQDLANELALEIANRYWDRRHDLEPETLSPEEAIKRGNEIDGGPVILVETSDCCGGGAAGDSIATLNALVDSLTFDESIVPVVDPDAADVCMSAGVGAELTIELGHKLDPRWGKSREFAGQVESLSDGEFVYTGGQWEGHREQMGPTVVFRIGTVRVLITSRATYDWADEQLRAVGIEPSRQKFIVAKNPMNYRLAYGRIAKAMLVLDTPGPTPATLKHVEFRKLKRPYFPADPEIPDFRPTLLTKR